MAVKVVKEVVTTITITLDAETAFLLQQYLDPDTYHPQLQDLLRQLQDIRLRPSKED